MAQNKTGKKKGIRPVYAVIAALSIIAITLAAILIILTGKSSRNPQPTAPVLIETDAPTAVQTEPATPAATGTIIPTDVPTETPTPEPTATPTPEPTGTPEPTALPATPTEVPTEAPTFLPVTDRSTSANPEYAGLKLVALTFDDGPNFSVTPDLLDVLAKHNAKVTFFILGLQLDNDSRNRTALIREAEEGHELGCHSWNHKNFKTLTPEQMLEEVSRTNNAIYELTGKTVTLLRLPGGNFNSTVRDTVQMPFIQWSCDSLDWQQLNPGNIKSYASEHGLTYEEAESELIDMVVFRGFNTYVDGHAHYNPPLTESMVHGAILLCHDIYKATPKAIDRLLTYMEEVGGYKFVTVTELVTSECPAPQAGYVYYKLWGTKI